MRKAFHTRRRIQLVPLSSNLLYNLRKILFRFQRLMRPLAASTALRSITTCLCKALLLWAPPVRDGRATFRLQQEPCIPTQRSRQTNYRSVLVTSLQSQDGQLMAGFGATQMAGKAFFLPILCTLSIVEPIKICIEINFDTTKTLKL